MSYNLLYGFKSPRKRGARGPAPGRACAPVSAPLQPGRCPYRALQQSVTCRQTGDASWLGRSAPRLYRAILGRASKIMAPTSCFTEQVHYLPDAPQAYGAMITRPKAAPPQSRSTGLVTTGSGELEQTSIWYAHLRPSLTYAIRSPSTTSHVRTAFA